MIAASLDSSRQHSRIGSRLRGPIVAGLLVISLAGCGTGESGSTDGEQGAGTSAEPSAKAMGIDTVEWPEDFEGARALFKRMPEELAGMRGTPEAAETLTLEYRAGEASAVVLGRAADEEIKDPRDALGAMFGLIFACEKGTYAGTAPQMQGEGEQAGPAFRLKGESPNLNGQLWWFACTVAGAEGDPTFRGHAIGWASGDIAWLTVSPDERTSQSLIDAMIKAR